MDFMSSAKRLSESASSSEDTQPASAAAAEADLLPSLWQELPVELLQKVLTKLPVSVLMKFSRVSKDWKEWIQSDEFGRNYNSVESTVFYFGGNGDRSYIALPSLKSDSWEKHFLEFVHEKERVAELVAVDRGLLCYKILKRIRYLTQGNEIVLVVQNPLTRKWRRLVVPHRLETDLQLCQSKMMVGLIVDPEAGSYKVVVAFINKYFKDSRNAFIYDSPSRTWRTSAAVSPVLENHFESVVWEVSRSINCGGELIWLVDETDFYGSISYKSLIKYRLEEDTWGVVSEPWADNGYLHIVHKSTEDRLFVVNFCNFGFGDFDGEEYIPPPFLSLVPSIGMFGSKDLYELFDRFEEDSFPVHFEPERAAYGGGTWFLTSESEDTGNPGRLVADVFAFSEHSSRSGVVRLPKLYDQCPTRLDTFEATLKAFV